MSVPVRAIVVDDSASNEAILSEELQRGGFEPELRRVASREEMEEALAQGEWDVVLSDLSATHRWSQAALTCHVSADRAPRVRRSPQPRAA